MKKSEFKNIIKEELKLLSEGYGPFPNPDIDLEQMAMAIGYTSFDDFLNENPGAKKAIIDWTLTIPDFVGSLERKGLNEGTSRDAFMAGWNQSKANLGKGKIRGDIRDIDAWIEYSQGSGSEEDKEAFLDGWFKARTTSNLSDVEKQMFDLKMGGKRDTPEYDKLIKRRAELEKSKMNESRTIIINSTEEWEDLVNNLKGYKYSGSLKPVNANRGLIQLSNYAKYPYEVMIDDKAKMIEFGEHSLKENKMTKQDIIRIINEEVNLALDEQEKQLYKVVDDKGKVIKPDEESDVDGLIKKIATKLAAKNPKWSVEKINEMYDPIYDSMIPEIAAMLMAGGLGIKAAIKYLKEKGLSKQDIIDIINKAKSKLNELKATNKGKDITKHLNDYLEGKINKSEFEELTGLKKESINESMKPTIVVYNGRRLAVDDENIERLRDGKDVVGKSLKHAGQEEWILAKGDWKIEESINENEGMTKSLKDIDPNLSLTKFDTTPPSFKITYMKREDMSKEMEEEIVAWVLSKGGKVQRVRNDYELEYDNDRHSYPNVYFKF